MERRLNMKLARDKITKEVKFSWDTHEVGLVGIVEPTVDDPNLEIVDMPEETIEGFNQRCKEKSPNGKVGRHRLLDDGSLEVDDPVVEADPILELFERIRVESGKRDTEPLTFGDLRNARDRNIKDRYGRL